MYRSTGLLKTASKCKMTAQMILVAIKGISRIIERISSNNDFVAPHHLGELLGQTINWSLFMLKGAQPYDKTIKRQQLPEDVIPKVRSKGRRFLIK